MSDTQSPQAAFAPLIPNTFEELGIADTLVMDLVLRRMLLEGYSNLQTLAAKLCLSMPIIDHTFAFEEARAAYEHLASGAHFGKVVIRLD